MLKSIVVAAAALASIAVAAPATAVHGDPSEWTWLEGQSNLTGRWDPCTAITWSTPHDGSAMEKSFAKGIRRVARFSGYSFQRVDSGGMITSTTRPSAEIGNYGGVANLEWRTGADGNQWTYRVLIVIATEQLDPAWVKYLPPLMLHELGHAMGLGHVGVDEEIMTNVAERPNRLGLGDRAGLAAMNPQVCAPVAISPRGTAAHQTRVSG